MLFRSAEVIVTALALDGFHDDGRHGVWVGLGMGPDGIQSGRLTGVQSCVLSLIHREADLWVIEARPVKFGEARGLVRIGVGDRERVARATVEGLVEVADSQMRGLLLIGIPVELALRVNPLRLAVVRLPVHRRLHGVLYSERAARDEEVMRQIGRSCDSTERGHRLGHRLCIEVRVGDLVDRRPSQLSLGCKEIGMVPAQRERGEAGEHVEDVATTPRIMEVAAS